jgi:cell division protein FtsQ
MALHITNKKTSKLFLGSSCVLLLLSLFIWREEIAKHGIELSAKLGFKVSNIYLSEVSYVDISELIRKADIRDGDPILAVDLAEMKSRIEAMDWVESVMIERRLPDTMRIFITEYQPKAIWQDGQDLYVIDEKGRIITKISEAQLSSFAELIILFGEDAKSYIGSLYSFLNYDEDVFNLVSFISRVGNRRWDVRLMNDIVIKLPEKEPEKAWRYLLSLNDELNILYTNIKVIDLRIKDKVFIELDTKYKSNRNLLREMG